MCPRHKCTGWTAVFSLWPAARFCKRPGSTLDLLWILQWKQWTCSSTLPSTVISLARFGATREPSLWSHARHGKHQTKMLHERKWANQLLLMFFGIFPAHKCQVLQPTIFLGILHCKSAHNTAKTCQFHETAARGVFYFEQFRQHRRWMVCSFIKF